MNKKFLQQQLLELGHLVQYLHIKQKRNNSHRKSGESLWSISNRYGITIAKLKSLNGLTSNLIFQIKY